jgi:hypothetical protein
MQKNTSQPERRASPRGSRRERGRLLVAEATVAQQMRHFSLACGLLSVQASRPSDWKQDSLPLKWGRTRADMGGTALTS